MTYQHCGMALRIPTKYYIFKKLQILTKFDKFTPLEMQMFWMSFEMLTVASKECCFLECGDATMVKVYQHFVGSRFLWNFIFLWPCNLVQFLLITNLTHFSNVFIYFTSLHVSSNPVLIIRRVNCINTSSGMYHSV
jgi:hypothetical protein